MIEDGHRCAFVRLMELYVNTDDVDGLSKVAESDDGRAAFMLYQYLLRRYTGADLEETLRHAARTIPRVRIWLAQHIARSCRTDEALTLLTSVDQDPWSAEEAQQASYRIQVDAGWIQPLR